mgnify:CR=1 FL=1
MKFSAVKATLYFVGNGHRKSDTPTRQPTQVVVQDDGEPTYAQINKNRNGRSGAGPRARPQPPSRSQLPQPVSLHSNDLYESSGNVMQQPQVPLVDNDLYGRSSDGYPSPVVPLVGNDLYGTSANPTVPLTNNELYGTGASNASDSAQLIKPPSKGRQTKRKKMPPIEPEYGNMHQMNGDGYIVTLHVFIPMQLVRLRITQNANQLYPHWTVMSDSLDNAAKQTLVHIHFIVQLFLNWMHDINQFNKTNFVNHQNHHTIISIVT